MVKEVVPFPKYFATLWMGTMKKPDDSSGFLLASVLIDDILDGLWNMLLDPYFVQVEVFSKHDGNLFLFELGGGNELLIGVEVFKEVEIKSLFDLFNVHFYELITLE